MEGTPQIEELLLRPLRLMTLLQVDSVEPRQLDFSLALQGYVCHMPELKPCYGSQVLVMSHGSRPLPDIIASADCRGTHASSVPAGGV